MSAKHLVTLLLLPIIGYSQLSWQNDSPVYTAGSLNHTYTNISALTPARSLSISVTGFTTFVNSSPASPNVPTSGTSRLSFNYNFNNGTQANNTSTITITFSHPACGLNFNIFDIDASPSGASGNFNPQDEIIINASDVNNTSIATPTISSASNNSVSGNIITGTNNAAGGTTNLISYPNTACVKTLVLQFRKGPNATGNPSSNAFSIGDLNSNETPGSPLPVKLVDFSGKPHKLSTMIQWQTSLEINNDYFEIQRSRTGQQFESIGRIKSQKDGQSNETYTFFDEKPFLGQNYYRLKQLDFDGTVSYSKIISVLWEPENFVNLYPNPIKEGSVLNIEKSELLQLQEIIDTRGRVISKELNELDAGMYILKFISDNNNQVIKKLMVE